jgi:3-methylcrotonyl-CoA carboxylase alpha subunit
LTKDGIVYFQTNENGSPGLEVKATYVKDHDFRVEADGVINDVNLAVYSKVFRLPLHR